MCYLNEIWKPIEGFSTPYEISEHGVVRSLNYSKTGEIKELKPKIDRYGYIVYGLSNNGKVTWITAHRLVYNAFFGTIPEGMQINHIDEDKTNNNINNLELVTPKENSNWGTRNERSGIKRRKPVVKCDLNGNEIESYSSIKEAAILNNTKPNYISAALNGYQQSAGGFKWKYK